MTLKQLYVIFFTLINFLQMLKIKTWLTETLLRVTNSELKNICDETLFEMKRSGEVIYSKITIP